MAGKPTKSQDKAVSSLSWRIESEIAADGSAKVDEIPTGEYRVGVTFEPAVPLAPGQQGSLTVKPGQEAQFQIAATNAFAIRGRVLSVVDQTPVADAEVQFMSRRDGQGRYAGRVTTAKDGSYLFHTTPGEVSATISSAPGFVGTLEYYGDLAKKRFPTLKVTKNTEWPDLEIPPASDVAVRVVDVDGKPVAGAMVRAMPAASVLPRHGGVSATTDAQGMCLIKGVAVDDTLPIWAKTADAVSDRSIVVTPSELDGPVEIEISPDNGVRFHCEVATRGGKPIPNANVTFNTSFRYVSKWVSGGMSLSGSGGVATTDAEGKAVSPLLWTGQTYWIKASAEGYDLAEAPQLIGERGTVDIKPFVLNKSRASAVIGTVVDEGGKPLPNAVVFAAGKKWRNPRTRTDENGKFKLDEVSSDIRYVFANAEGFRFGGARVSSEQPVSVTLRSNDADPKGVRPARSISLEERSEIAERLASDLLALVPNPRNTAQIDPLKALARIDVDNALALAEAGNGRFGYAVREVGARRLAATDPDKAIQMLRSSRYGLRHAVEIGSEYASGATPGDQATAARFAAFAVELAETKAKPALEYPQIVPLLTRLGQHEKAEVMIRKPLEELAKLPAIEGRNTYLAQQTAIGLAPYDYKKAVELCSQLKAGYTRTRALANAIVGTAYQDIDKAIARLDALQGDSNTPNIRDKAKARIAKMIVADDPDKAIEIVRSCREDDNRAQAIAQIIVPLSKLGRKTDAWKLVDEVLEIHRAETDAFMSWSNYGGGGPFAAAFALRARQAGYPDMESVVWHVRAAARAKSSDKGMERLRATIITAKILALTDRIASRELLRLIDHQVDQIEGNRLYHDWVKAWILTDFNRGVALLADQVEADKKMGGRASRTYNIELLMVTEPSEQLRVITRDDVIWNF